MDLELGGKTVLITGASKGIGLECAKTFAKEGAKLILVARTAETLDAVAADLKAGGADVRTVAADLSQQGTAEKIAADAGAIDILINNAGAIPAGDLFAVDEATWRGSWDLKVFGYINMTRAFYGLMKAAGRGTIINVIGAAATKLDPGYICGSVGNAALEAFTKSVGSISMEDNIRITALSPGGVETERMTALLKQMSEARLGDADKWRVLMKDLPQGRGATTGEVANTVVFLASPLSSYTSGTVMNLDGGYSIR